MPELHKQLTAEDIKKIMWCGKAALYLEEVGCMEFHEAFEYAEILHYDYVELNGEFDSDPIEVVKEDMTYWD